MKNLRVAFVFAGQGAQYSGMGKELYENSPAAKKIFETAGEQVKEWCFEGSEELLKETRVTQPSLYTVTLAAYAAFKEAAEKAGILEGLYVLGVAGFSLGEYAALTVAGSIENITDGMDIVTHRGIWMNEAGLDEEGNQQGSMMAMLGARHAVIECVDEAREDGILEAVNFNSPMQTVAAGDKTALERLRKIAKERKVKAIPLKVGTAFHSPMMEPAAEKLAEHLMKFEIKKPQMKVYSNISGTDIMANFEGDDSNPLEIKVHMVEKMARQAKSPVYWQETIENLIGEGAEIFIEFGAGNTLCNIIKKIDENVTVLNVQDMESLSNTINSLLEVKND